MYDHLNLADTTIGRRKRTGELIRSGEIGLGGHKKDKIYGLLTCSSGKRMKIENRVFFKDEQEAISNGFRPCGNCMRERYMLWKSATANTYKR